MRTVPGVASSLPRLSRLHYAVAAPLEQALSGDPISVEQGTALLEATPDDHRVRGAGVRDRARRGPPAAHERRPDDARRTGDAEAAEREHGVDGRDREPTLAGAGRGTPQRARQGPRAAPRDDP